MTSGRIAIENKIKGRKTQRDTAIVKVSGLTNVAALEAFSTAASSVERYVHQCYVYVYVYIYVCMHP